MRHDEAYEASRLWRDERTTGRDERATGVAPSEQRVETEAIT
jgi:hypothetical protein